MTNQIQNQSVLTQKHYWDEFYQDELKFITESDNYNYDDYILERALKL